MLQKLILRVSGPAMSAVRFSDASHTTNLLITTSYFSPPILITERERDQALIIDQGSVPMNVCD